MKMNRKEFEATIANTIEKVMGYEKYLDEGITEEMTEKICEVCPFANICGKEELYWGCTVWEYSMGDDL